MNLSTPRLEPIMQLTVHVAQPVDAGQVIHALGEGRRRIIPITGGADFQLVTSSVTDQVAAQLDARYILRLSDGSHIYVTNLAVRTGSPQDIASLVRGESVPPERIYFRCAPRFEVERADLAWMTQTLFIGTGARFPDRVEMVFYEVI
jgi:hypothetical protein